MKNWVAEGIASNVNDFNQYIVICEAALDHISFQNIDTVITTKISIVFWQKLDFNIVCCI